MFRVNNEIKCMSHGLICFILQTAVSNTGCGTKRLCRAQPSSCNPAVSGSTCSFLSAKQISGQIYSFEISGQSSGYIGSLLSVDTTWVCQALSSKTLTPWKHNLKNLILCMKTNM